MRCCFEKRRNYKQLIHGFVKRRVIGNIGNIHKLPRFFHIIMGVAWYEKCKNEKCMYTKTIHKQGKTHGNNFAHILKLCCSKMRAKSDQNGSNLTPKGAPGATRAPKMVGKGSIRDVEKPVRVHKGPQEGRKGP